jgi:hypothetical protein
MFLRLIEKTRGMHRHSNGFKITLVYQGIPSLDSIPIPNESLGSIRKLSGEDRE